MIKLSKEKKNYKYPAWKRQWLNMSAVICILFGSMTLIQIVVDYVNDFSGCQPWYGLAATISAILYAAGFWFNYFAEIEKLERRPTSSRRIRR